MPEWVSEPIFRPALLLSSISQEIWVNNMRQFVQQNEKKFSWRIRAFPVNINRVVVGGRERYAIIVLGTRQRGESGGGQLS